MKLSAALVLILVFSAFTFKANAAEQGLYVQGSVYGTDMTDTEIKALGFSQSYNSNVGLGGGAEVGYRFNPYLRTSLEASYRHNDVSNNNLGAKGEFDSYAGMGNVYLDIPTGGKLTPYVGGGAGYAYVTDTDVHDTVFAYQGMAGLSYAATNKLDVVLGYKYFATSTPEYGVSGFSVKAPYKTHNIELGVRYSF